MTEAELAVVREWADAMTRGELRLDLCSPDAVIVNARDWVVDATYHGREGLQRWWDDIADAFDDMRMQVELVEPVAGGRVLSRQRMRGRFRSSEIDIDVPWWSVLTIRDGLIVHAIGYLSEREARQAISLG
jgi:hypothetical protein